MTTQVYAERHLHHHVGDAFTYEVVVYDSDGTVRDISNDVLRAQFNFDTSVVLTTGSGITKTDATSGVFTWTLSKTQSAVSAGNYTYGVKLETSSGDEYTIVWGTLELLDQVVD